MITLRPRAGARARCPACGEGVGRDELATACRGCGALCHAGCAVEWPRCAACRRADLTVDAAVAGRDGWELRAVTRGGAEEPRAALVRAERLDGRGDRPGLSLLLGTRRLRAGGWLAAEVVVDAGRGLRAGPPMLELLVPHGSGVRVERSVALLDAGPRGRLARTLGLRPRLVGRRRIAVRLPLDGVGPGPAWVVARLDARAPLQVSAEVRLDG